MKFINGYLLMVILISRYKFVTTLNILMRFVKSYKKPISVFDIVVEIIMLCIKTNN